MVRFHWQLTKESNLWSNMPRGIDTAVCWGSFDWCYLSSPLAGPRGVRATAEPIRISWDFTGWGNRLESTGALGWKISPWIKVTPQKTSWAKPAKCTHFAYQHHPKTPSSSLWTRDVVKITPWLQHTDSSSQHGLCELIKSQRKLGRTNENINPGIFSTTLMYIFLSFGIYPLSPPHHPLYVAPRAINPVLKTAISFTIQTTASTCLHK